MASSQGTDADKSSLRSNYLAARAGIPVASRRRSDDAIRTRLLSLPVVREATVVLTYVSVCAEVDTRVLIEELLDAGRAVAVPLTDPAAHTMSFRRIASLDELCPGAYGIPEPSDAAPALAIREMVGSVCLVPGLVFDGVGHRVGYGGGYYDRFLPFYPGWKVAPARTTQLSSNTLPTAAHDVPVDFIVTEATSWRCW